MPKIKSATKKRTRPAIKPSRRKKNIRELFEPHDIAGALKVIRHHLKKNDVRVALYVLDQYFGKPAQQTELAETPKKPVNIKLTNEYLDQLAQKYLPKPQVNA